MIAEHWRERRRDFFRRKAGCGVDGREPIWDFHELREQRRVISMGRGMMPRL
jgi:hypothetical protein